MKILFPLGSLYPAQSGGPSNTIYWLAKELKDNKLETIIITTNKDIKDNNIRLNYFTEQFGVKTMYCKETNYKFSFNLIKNSIKELKNVDIVHLTSLFFIPSIFIAFFARIYNKKVVWSVRGELELGALKYSKIFKKVYLLLIKLVINKKFIFHATSENEKKRIEDFFPKNKNYILPNYLELPRKIEKQIEKQILFLGRIHPIKGLENLINGLALSQTFLKSEFILKIAGKAHTNEYLNKLKELVSTLKLENKIDFIGVITGNKKEEILASSYFLVLPSYSENFGNVIVESLSQGTPCIASKGTPWEKLEMNNSGFWVENTPEELSFCIEKVLNIPEAEYLKMRIDSLKFVKTNFDIKNNINTVINKYKEVI